MSNPISQILMVDQDQAIEFVRDNETEILAACDAISPERPEEGQDEVIRYLRDEIDKAESRIMRTIARLKGTAQAKAEILLARELRSHIKHHRDLVDRMNSRLGG